MALRIVYRARNRSAIQYRTAAPLRDRVRLNTGRASWLRGPLAREEEPPQWPAARHFDPE